MKMVHHHHHHQVRHREVRERERYRCCCCGAKIWTIFFAVLQIIIYILELVAVGLFYTGYLGRTGRSPRSPEEEGGAMALVIIGALFSILGILTGIIFIKAAHRSNIKNLTVGMVCAALCYTWKLIELGLEVGVSGGNILVTSIGVIVITIVYGFSFWAAYALKREIREGRWINGIHIPRPHNPHVIVIPPTHR